MTDPIEETVEAVRRFIRRTGRVPRIREVATELGLKSNSNVLIRLERAENAGRLINRQTGRGRTSEYVPADFCPICFHTTDDVLPEV